VVAAVVAVPTPNSAAFPAAEVPAASVPRLAIQVTRGTAERVAWAEWEGFPDFRVLGMAVSGEPAVTSKGEAVTRGPPETVLAAREVAEVERTVSLHAYLAPAEEAEQVTGHYWLKLM